MVLAGCETVTKIFETLGLGSGCEVWSPAIVRHQTNKEVGCSTPTCIKFGDHSSKLVSN